LAEGLLSREKAQKTQSGKIATEDTTKETAEYAKYAETTPAKLGKIVQAARTISMKEAVGTVCNAFFNTGSGHDNTPPVNPVNGPWLDGTHSNHHNNPWRTYGKTSDMVSPAPANLWVVIEENPLSINDAGLAVSASVAEWIDFPSTLHNMGCVLAFGDGHAELHKWTGLTLRLSGLPSRTTVLLNDPDWTWLVALTSALAH
jgi:hypothetical protein